MSNILPLTDESGNTVDYEYLDSIKYEGKEYVFLIPDSEEKDEFQELLVLQIEKENAEEDDVEFISVNDDEILEKLLKLFKKKLRFELEFSE